MGYLMMKPASPLALALTVLLAPAVMAQTTPTAPLQVPAPPADQAPATPADTAADPAAEPAVPGLSLGEQVTDESPIGTTYVAQSFDDWQLTCTKSETGVDPCQLYQLMQDDQGNSVAEVSMFNLPKGQQAVAGATIVTPLETLLTAQVTMRIDNGAAKRYPFTFCAPVGCIARVGFTEAELAGFRKGAKGTVVIVPAMLPDEQVPITMSLKGFTAAYEAMTKANAAADAAAAEAAKTAKPAEAPKTP
jgi:invasion protein IalB